MILWQSRNRATTYPHTRQPPWIEYPRGCAVRVHTDSLLLVVSSDLLVGHHRLCDSFHPGGKLGRARSLEWALALKDLPMCFCQA